MVTVLVTPDEFRTSEIMQVDEKKMIGDTGFEAAQAPPGFGAVTILVQRCPLSYMLEKGEKGVKSV